MILRGGGVSTWEATVIHYLKGGNPSKDQDALEREVEQAQERNETYYSEQLVGDQVVAVLGSPAQPKTKDTQDW